MCVIVQRRQRAHPTPPSPEERAQKNCVAMIREKGPNFAVEETGTNLDSLFKLLYLVLDRPVIDRTGIKGRFDISMEFARPEGRPVFRPVGEPVPPPALPPENSDEPAGPSIFTVVQQQLGLKPSRPRGPGNSWSSTRWRGPPETDKSM